MIFTDSRARRERLTPLDHNGVFVVVNGAGRDAGRGKFPLFALLRNEYTLGVRLLVFRLLRLLVVHQLFVLLKTKKPYELERFVIGRERFENRMFR